jgi:hypothetical protein
MALQKQMEGQGDDCMKEMYVYIYIYIMRQNKAATVLAH